MSTSKELFVFNKDNLKKAQKIVSKYPIGRQKSAMLPLLDMAQRQNDGWLSVPAIEYVANYISEPYMRAYEVASFYTMYNLKPVGRYHIQICGTTPCWLKGAGETMDTCEKLTKTKCGKTSEDGMFTISEVECLGACVNAPIIQINDNYYENLDSKKLNSLIKELKSKKQ